MTNALLTMKRQNDKHMTIQLSTFIGYYQFGYFVGFLVGFLVVGFLVGMDVGGRQKSEIEDPVNVRELKFRKPKSPEGSIVTPLA